MLCQVATRALTNTFAVIESYCLMHYTSVSAVLSTSTMVFFFCEYRDRFCLLSTQLHAFIRPLNDVYYYEHVCYFTLNGGVL